MKREYREINLEKFVPEEEEKLTKTEKEHIKKQFYESTGITKKDNKRRSSLSGIISLPHVSYLACAWRSHQLGIPHLQRH